MGGPRNSGLTPKQEKFCREFIKDGNASAAYLRSYDSNPKRPESVHEQASRLLKNANVAARIKEIQERISNAKNITLESHLERLAQIAESAYLEGKYSAASQCEVARGRVSGFYIEKMQVDVTLRGMGERMRSRMKDRK